ncbi:MAG: ROK family protein [SAR324 cluster bacterium]|nr:ROK family protein [SAR324 cluster bacterium]
MKRIGVDLGGTKTEIILTGDNVLDIVERKRVPTIKDQGYERLIAQIAELINEFQSLVHEDEEITIGMGIPGSVFPPTGLVQSANTQCLIGHPLKKDLEALIKHEIRIENDANCFALSEALIGAGKGHESVLGIIMGTGMGGGIVLSGKLRKGVHGNAGEWGHMALIVNGTKCWCGQNGCMELYLSGTGIQRIYQERTGKKRILQEIYQGYEAGSDLAAEEVFEEFIFNFGRGMANLITIFDPSIIVIGGGVSNLPILYSEGVSSTTRQSFRPELPIPIVKNQLGDSSGIFGAAMLTE